MQIPILSVRDENGNTIPIPAIKGDKGNAGEKGDPGDVSSVNGVQPNEAGEVALEPGDIGALPAALGTTPNLLLGTGAGGAIGVKTANDAVKAIGAGRVNPNLLRNWHFGKPVNQRSIQSGASLTNSFFFDCWNMANVGTVNYSSAGMVIASTNATYNSVVQQFLETPPSGTVTLSLLTSDNLYSITTDTSVSAAYSPRIAGSVSDFTFGWGSIDKAFYISLAALATTSTIIAAKLELGSYQTLAHKEGDAWVLNEIPDYATELAKCQRYYLPVALDTPIVVVALHVATNLMRMFIPTLAPLCKIPTLGYATGFLCQLHNGTAWFDLTNLRVLSLCANGVSIDCNYTCSLTEINVNVYLKGLIFSDGTFG